MANIRKVYKLTVPLTDALHKRLASLAAKQGRTMAGLVRWWVDRGEAGGNLPSSRDVTLCPKCHGNGVRTLHNGVMVCPSCDGRGEVRP